MVVELNEALHLYLKGTTTQCITVDELDETVGSEDEDFLRHPLLVYDLSLVAVLLESIISQIHHQYFILIPNENITRPLELGRKGVDS